MAEQADRLRILLVGNGGREHALAWKLSQSARVQKFVATQAHTSLLSYQLKAGILTPLIGRIYVVPGNGGTARGLRNVSNVTEVKPDDFPGLVKFASEHNVNLVIPGPEAPLVAGIEGHFRKGGNCRCPATPGS